MGRPVRERPVARARRAVPVHPLRLAAAPSTTSRARTRTRRRWRAAGLLDADDEAEIHRGLDVLAERYTSGALRPDPGDEDVHGALERLLIEEIGPEVGGRLRAGRSRNDQIATLFRSYLLDHSRRPGRPGPGPRGGARRPGAGAPRRDHARTHPPAARPAGAALAPPAGPRLGAAARRGPARRLAAADGGRVAVRLRGAGRVQPRPGPRAGRARAGLRRLERQLDRRRPPAATSSASSPSWRPRSGST